MDRRSTLSAWIAQWLAVAFVILVCGQAGAQSGRTKDVSGDANRGKEIYVRDGCYECHGFAGQGSTLSGPRIGPGPIPFNGLVNYVRQPPGQMPPYTRKVMSDAELADIYVFLQSLPKPADTKEIQVLKPQNK